MPLHNPYPLLGNRRPHLLQVFPRRHRSRRLDPWRRRRPEPAALPLSLLFLALLLPVLPLLLQ